MKNFYYTLIIFVFSYYITAQTTPTGNSTEVGVTEGQLSVSLTGSATYAIPIAVPPGINGVVPQVSLVYNSQGGNGIAGYGWNISGVTMINRIPSTKFHDGVTDPVDFDNLDRFALDGQRLIVKTGTSGIYGKNLTEYETEGFSNIKITSYGVHPAGVNYGPAYFIVEYPDGSKAQYGNSIDSRSITDWAITYWQNPQGVRINYSYILADNNLRIEYIKYGTTYTNAPINEVKFVYNPRQRAEQYYVGGQNIIKNKILSEIQITGNRVSYRNYILNQDITSLGYERLTSITEKSRDGKSYNPMVFTYAENISTIGITSLTPLYLQNNVSEWFSETSPPKIINGDFDGDGDLDFMANSVMYTKVLDNGSNPVKFDFDVYLNHFSYNNRNLSAIKCLEESSDGYKLMTRDAVCTVGYPSLNKDVLQFNIFSKDQISNSSKLEYTKKIDIINATAYVDKTFDGDFNGDGLTDKIVIKDIYNSGDNYYDLHNANLYFVNLDRRITSNYVKDLGIIPNVYLGYRNQLLKTADVNGDGKTDLIFFNGGTINSISVYSLDANENLIKLWETPIPFVHTTYNNEDRILFEHVPGKGIHHTFGPDGWADGGYYYDVDPISYEYVPIIGDFNGDGKSDIILSGFERTALLSTGFSFEKESLSNNFPAQHDIGALLANDFNNDSKIDVLFIKHNHTKNLQPMNEVVLTMNHLTWVSKNNWATHESSFPNLNANFFRYGINPIMIKPSKLFKDKPEILLYEAEPSFGAKDSQGNDVTLIRAYKIGFFVKHDALTNSIKSIKSITTGNGVKETITYSPLINGNNVYTAVEQIENYPNIDIVNASNFQVVSKLEQQSSTVYKKKIFSYNGAVSNIEGLGFLGFRSTVQTNWHNDSNSIISSISKFDIEQRGANIENYTVLGQHAPLISNGKQKSSKIVKEGVYNIVDSENLIATQSIILKPDSWIKQGSTFSAKIITDANKSSNTPTDFITKSILTYESELLSNKVFKIQNTISKQYNALENTSSEITTVYDTYNNPTQSTTLLKESGKTVQTTVNNITYIDQPNPGSTYYIGRPTNKKQRVEVTGDNMNTEEKYQYTNHLLTQIKKKRNNSDFVTEDNIYDTFGNIKIKTITAPGLDPRTTNYDYDTTNRFLVKFTDIEKLSTIYNYNQSSGVLNFETNPYGLTTTYEYDSWFKKTKTIDYLGQNNTYVYTKNGNVNTLVTTTGSDGSGSQQLFDDLGRKITSGVKDINGLITNVAYEYDIYDREYKVSEPYYGSPTQYSITEYDNYGRVIKSNSFTGKTVSIVYNASSLISNVKEDSNTKIFTKNAMGNIISMNDSSGGTINYTYFADGNLKETNYDGIKTIIEEDDWGRKKNLIDPSAGTYSYGYNSFGETTSVTTLNGITTYKLDSFGKPESKTIINPVDKTTDSETIYTYDSSKLLTKTEFKDGVSKTTLTTDYIYDDKKRISQITETNSLGAVFIKKIDYDLLGRTDITTSTAKLGNTSSIVKTQNIYKNGYLWQIKDFPNTKTLWETNATNARGQLTSAKTGNVTITNEYDSYGYVSKMQNDLGISNIMKLVTEFDAQKGNLKNRNNSLFGYNEIFDYDEQDRLTNITKDDTFIYNAFNTPSTEGYQTEGGANTMSFAGALTTQVATSGATLKKNLLTTAVIGDKITINFNLQKTVGNDILNVYIQEEDTGTGAVVKYLKTIATPGLVNFTHTVTQYSKVSLRIEKANTTTTNIFVIDNVAVAKRSATTQAYNKRGLITKNELGDYNYKDLDPQKAYRNTEILPTPETLLYYTGKQIQNITYNTFKSPIQIEDGGIDKVSFVYNDNNDRSVMFYGGLQNDQLLRKYRKYYSSDGSMEIKQDITTSGLEFITYIGGDAYTAPLLVKSNGTTQNYLYLHRDYQGSILAITDQAGAVLEKRLFDAWGSILKVQDSAGNVLPGLTVLDRGYTGHEHIQSVGIINMNGRLYDPMLRRFLQPDNNIQDPFNTENYNRYGYVLNNPLKYTDPSGESWEMIFGFFFSAYIHGASASGGELNPAKWNSNGWTNAFTNVGSVLATTGATYYVNGYMENYNNAPELGVSASSGGSSAGSINSSSDHSFVIDWSKLGTRVLGGLQMVGGAVEVIGGGIGGTITFETGVGTVLGYAVAMNGIDNATTGAIQLWTGESQNTLLHKGVRATSEYAGASYDTAESMATYADIATIALGGISTTYNGAYKGYNYWRVPKARLSSAEQGKIIGWGETQSTESIQQTIEVTQNLTKSQIKKWEKLGVRKLWVEYQLNKYHDSFEKKGKKLINKQLPHRMELMKKILELWK